MDLNETLRWQNVGLPEDIERLKAAGFYEEAIALIDRRLTEDWEATANGGSAPGMAENPMPRVPSAQAACMIAQREMLRRLPAEYPYTEKAALTLIRQDIPDFPVEEFRALVAENRIDWRFVNGQKQFQKRFWATLLDTDPDLAQRAGKPHTDAVARDRDRQIALMHKKGRLGARIALREEIRPSDAAFAAALAQAKAAGKNTVTAKVWLPLPIACPSQSEISLDGFSRQPTSVGSEVSSQRTAYWEVELAENTTFSAKFSYQQDASCRDPFSRTPDRLQPSEYLGEEAPHIVFTPYLKALVAQLTDGAKNPAEKARRIYDYLTLNVKYRYMPAYFVLEDIADNCARSRRGDCGVMALAFITMCRIAGIPARWESGLSVRPERAGCHDWARFYIAPMGWMYADVSFGASAARAGNEERRRHYFGSIDPCRMVANSAFMAQLTPPKTTWRDDPYDNQTGEIELEGVGLYGDDVESSRTVLRFEEF